jgi:hypothetical protein
MSMRMSHLRTRAIILKMSTMEVNIDVDRRRIQVLNVPRHLENAD